jgi:hypothetical protein
MRKLDQYLTQRGLAKTPIFGAIVFTRDVPQVQLSFREPALPSAPLSSLVPMLRNFYLTQDRMDAARAQQIVKLLFE